MISGFPFISAIMATVFLGAIIIMLLPAKNEFAIKLIAILTGFVSLVLSLAVFFLFDRNSGGFQFSEQFSWLPQLGISYHVGVDGISVLMLLLTGIIIFTGSIISSYEFKPGGLLGKTGRPKEFFVMLLFLVTGVFGVFVSLDLLVLFLFYELAVLPMYLLIGIWGTGKKEYAAMKLTLYLLLGSALILVGILALYFASGLRTFDWVILSSCTFGKTFQVILFPIVFVGFGILAGLWPFHTWSPDGHASAPSAVSMLHAGVLMKLGAFSIIRVALPLLPYGTTVWAPFFACLAVVNIVYGALVAMAQKDLKYVIAYSSVSHMGIVMLGICSLNVIGLNGSVFQMFSHGVMTGLFFALVGAIYGRTHTRILADMGGLAKLAPFLAITFAIGGLASLGLPGTSGFISEFLVLLGTFQSYPLLSLVAATGVVITAIYVLRVLQKIFFGPVAEQYVSGKNKVTDATLFEKFPLSILIFCLILFGVWPSLFTNVVNSGITMALAKIGGIH